MKLALTLLLYLLCIFLGVSIWAARKQKTELADTIVKMFYAEIIVLFGNSLSIIAQDTFAASLGFCIYYCGMDWMLVAMVDYAEKYTENFTSNKVSRWITYAICVIDNCMILLHMFNGYLFKISEHPLKNGRAFYVAGDFAPYYSVHLTICYIMVAFIILSFVFRIVKTPKFYHSKFVIILVAFIVLILMNAVYLMLGMIVDISVFFYGIMSLAICFLSIYYVPKGLVDRTLTFVVSGMNDAVWCYDLWGKNVYVNSRARELFKEKDKSEKQVAEALFQECYEKNRDMSEESVRWIRKHEAAGMTYYYEVIFRKLFDDRRDCIGYCIFMTDRSEEVENIRRDHIQATRDKLTGLYNREYFYEKAQKKLAENPKDRFKLVCSNIRGFKLFNDLFGEQRGNEVLLMEAELLRHYSATSSVYGRLQGDEFAILVSADADEQIFIERINDMKARFSNNQYAMHIQMGVYDVQDNSEPIALMCDKARFAMQSFQGDFNTVAIRCTEEILQTSVHDSQLLNELDVALKERQFRIFLQPQISTDGKMVGAEALVRWLHPQRGLVFPGDFIPALERTGLIYKVDQYVWELAAERLAKWKAWGREELYISVNISAKDFYYIDIYKEFTSLVEKYNISPKNLKLEITETVLMSDAKKQMQLLESLRQYGFLIEIDDFGSGYSSLNMLKDICVDVLKIDMGFLCKTNQVEKGSVILKSVMDMAKLLKMEIITEGVETEEQVRQLTAMGCGLFQGYFFSRPMPILDFEGKYRIEGR